ncbi:hypothetical protein [Sporolactobacillus pectinivorans]|nr:hypothetical protein [Sporolactobacillus pectinivorans]
MAEKRFFSFTGTKRKQTAANRIEDNERINRLKDEMLTKRMFYSKFF